MLTQNQTDALSQRIGEVLHYIWDPIGVSGVPQVRDEYDSYVPGILNLLVIGSSTHEIGTHLNNIVTDRMGLKGNLEQSLQIADILIDWNDFIREPPA